MARCERCGQEGPDEQLVAIPHYRICAACDRALGGKIAQGVRRGMPRGTESDFLSRVLLGGAPSRDTPPSRIDINPADEPAPGGETAAMVEYEGKTFRADDRIRIRLRAGTFKPHETGHRAEVDAAAGRTGRVCCFVRRGDGPAFILARIRWDRQAWDLCRGSGSVTLEEFEATIHVDYLEVTP